MVAFGIVGAGWRAEFYGRIALACPDKFRCVGMFARRREARDAFSRKFGIKAFGSIEEMARKGNPDFAVSCVSWEGNPVVIDQLVELGMPVLSETPPAKTVEELESLYELVRRGARIQVAEQYFLQPHHAARLAFAHGGKIGRVSQAQVSVAHGYHGISLIRKLLGARFEEVVVSARRFRSPKLDEGGRTGPPEQESVVESEQTIAYLDFGDKLGVFDFANAQYWGATRGPRLLVRGERGEIVNNSAVYLRDPGTPIHCSFERREAGQQGNLEGHYLKGIQADGEWMYRNPFGSARLFDDEIAIADCLRRMGDYLQGGPELYPLAEACQDRYLDILIEEAAESGGEARSARRSWSAT